MFQNRSIPICRFAAAIAAATAVGAFAAAHAEAPSPAHFVAPGVTSVAVPAATPAPISNIVTPRAQPAGTEKPAAIAPAVTPLPVASAVCTTPAEFSRFDHPLFHTARALADGKPVTVVAIGSSSTAGAGASSQAATYPSRLAVELRQRFPGHSINVLNRGVNGQETDEMMARFKSGVIAEHPQLVIWQIGTNSVLRDHPLQPHSVLLHEGIEELKATGADVLLIDPQYAPKVLAKSETPGMVDQIALAAKEENVDLFQRFAVMRDWYEVQHLSFATFVSPDGLHMNDWGYACVAKLLATGIAEAATRPIASAAVHPATKSP
jgi:acyl-CoA thioesterase I